MEIEMLDGWDTEDLLKSYYNNLADAALNMACNKVGPAKSCLLEAKDFADELKSRNVDVVDIKPANKGD